MSIHGGSFRLGKSDIRAVLCLQGQRRAAATSASLLVDGNKENEMVQCMKKEIPEAKRNEAARTKDENNKEKNENPGAWWRGKGKGKKHRQHAMRVAHYLSIMKEQYEEIDAFELPAETPSPCQQTSICWHGEVSPAVGDVSVSGRKKSHMFGRVSLGLQDALGWLTKQGSLLKSGRKSRASSSQRLEYGEPLKDELRTPATSKVMCTIAESDHDLDVDVKNILEDIQEKHKDPLMTPNLEDSFKDKLKIQSELDTPNMAELSQLPPVEQLLGLCGQSTNVNSVMTMDELLGKHVDLSTMKKVGEGTFGEAFRANDLVFKIIPIEGEGEAQKTASEILGEAAVSMALSKLGREYSMGRNATSGFVKTHGIGVCRGKYSSALSKEWHRWDRIYTSENEAVDGYGENQLYAVFVVANGGMDLESFKPQSFREIISILLQTVVTLAVAENACEFEHRDLHWGNILVQRDGSTHVGYTLNGVDISVESSGVRVTLIDFTLSRLTTMGGEAAYCDLSTDPEIFNGPKGDPQAEAYRKMRETVSDWKKYVPSTNAIWIEYLSNIMMHYKCPTNCKKANKESLGSLQKDAAGAHSAEELLFHPLFAGMWSSSDHQ